MNGNTIYLSDKLTPELQTMIKTFYTSFSNPKVLDQVLDKDFIDHMPFNPDSPAGIDGFKKTIEAYSTIFSQFNFDFQGIYIDGDKLIVRHIATAIHSGEFLGIKPTDKLVTWHSIDIYTVKDNKLIEGWHVESFLKTYLDMLSNN